MNDPAVGMPFLPRLPEPAPRTVAAAPSPAAVAGAPTGADHPIGAALAAGGSVATMERSVVAPASEALSVAPREQRPPRRSIGESVHDFVTALPVILLALLVAGGSLYFVDSWLAPATLRERSNTGSNDSGSDIVLPRFSSPPPAYGTLTFHIVQVDGADMRMTMSPDGSDVWFEYFPFSGVTPGAGVLANAGARFVRDSAGSWQLADVQGSSRLLADVNWVSPLTFDRYVPEEMRPYVTVETRRTVALSGRQLDEYTLRFDLAASMAAEPVRTTAWASEMAFDPQTPKVRFVLSVDAQGVVWKTVFDDPVGADIAWTLEYMGPELFVVQFPTTYYNAVTGQQVNG